MFLWHVRCVLFRHRKLGTMIELDESSSGDFRCCSNDFDRPFIVTKYGLKSPIDSFCLSEFVEKLRSFKVLGNQMLHSTFTFGDWSAEVCGAIVMIKNALAVCCTTPTKSNSGVHCLERRLQIVLTIDSLVCVGMSTSINIPAVSFRISNGVPEQTPMSWDGVNRFVARASESEHSVYDVSYIQVWFLKTLY